MKVKATEVDNSPVISSEDGASLGTVKTLVLDVPLRRFTALEVNRKDGSDKKYLLIPDAQAVGNDSVVVSNKSKFKNAAELPEFVAKIAKDKVSTTFLIGTKVMTSPGNDAGVIRDVEFDSKTGDVLGLIISQGLKDLISGRKHVDINDVQTIGDDAVIVANEPKNSKEIQKPNPQSLVVTEPAGDDDPELKDVAGKYAMKNILLNTDEILVKRGEIITFSHARKAKDSNLLDELRKYSNISPP